MRIKELSECERPREKMISLGPESMGNAELLAILLRSGKRNRSAVELGQELLNSAGGSLVELFGMSAGKMLSIDGIGKCKAAQIQAAVELGKRFLTARAGGTAGTPIMNPRMVYDIMSPTLRALRHEECWVMFLGNRNHLLSRERVTTGGSRSTVIDPHEIVRKAIERGAGSIVLVHNHPGGDPRPSPADIKQTEILHGSTSACDISLLDHIIVAADSFYSFSDDRLYECDNLVLDDIVSLGGGDGDDRP